MRTNKRYWVSETYSECTPESAENGDFSETGYCFGYNPKNKFRQAYTLKELIESHIRGDYGCVENFRRDEAHEHSLYQSHWHTSDYSTGTERQECLHIRPMAQRGTKAYRRAMRHLNRALVKYLND